MQKKHLACIEISKWERVGNWKIKKILELLNSFVAVGDGDLKEFWVGDFDGLLLGDFELVILTLLVIELDLSYPLINLEYLDDIWYSN